MTIPDQYYSGIVQFNVNEDLPPEKIGTACGILFRDMRKMLGNITEVSWHLRMNMEIEQENGDKEMKHLITCTCKKVEAAITYPLSSSAPTEEDYANNLNNRMPCTDESYVGDGDLPGGE